MTYGPVFTSTEPDTPVSGVGVSSGTTGAISPVIGGNLGGGEDVSPVIVDNLGGFSTSFSVIGLLGSIEVNVGFVFFFLSKHIIISLSFRV